MPEDVRIEVDRILSEDEAARVAVEKRLARVRRRRQYSPRIETTPRIVASHAERNIDELRADYRLFGEAAKCLVGQCSQQAIQCHQTSRRTQLKHIREHGKVWWFDKFRNGYIGAGGPQLLDGRGIAVPQPSLVGARHATTFRGFCKTHDRECFALIDGNHLCGTKKQLSQILYRAVSYEAYWKRWESSPTKQALDRMAIDRIIGLHREWESTGPGESNTNNRSTELTSATLWSQVKDRLVSRRLDEWLVWIGSQLRRHNEIDSIRAIEMRIKGRPFVACSGLVTARHDFAERAVVDTTRARQEQDTIAIMTTWFHSSTEWSLLLVEAGTGAPRVHRYVESLSTHYSRKAWLERLATWMMVSSGNAAMKPTWWGRIGDHNRMVCGLIQQQHHGDGRTDLTNEYWKEPFVGDAEVTSCRHWY